MTHDELLAKVKKLKDSYDTEDYAWSALRAVVELHKPFLFPEDDLLYCEEDNQPYPCGTIQFIEKELA